MSDNASREPGEGSIKAVEEPLVSREGFRGPEKVTVLSPRPRVSRGTW